MVSLQGIYDGHSVKITEKFNDKKQYKVVVTFIEEIKPMDKSLRNFSAQTKGLDFWENEAEDLYQDFVKK